MMIRRQGQYAWRGERRGRVGREEAGRTPKRTPGQHHRPFTARLGHATQPSAWFDAPRKAERERKNTSRASVSEDGDACDRLERAGTTARDGAIRWRRRDSCPCEFEEAYAQLASTHEARRSAGKAQDGVSHELPTQRLSGVVVHTCTTHMYAIA